MSISINSVIYFDERGKPRIPCELDFDESGVLSHDKAYLFLVSICHYKDYCVKGKHPYDERSTNMQIMLAKTLFDIQLRLVLNTVNFDPVETMCQTYDLREEKNLRNHYNVVPGYMNQDGVPRVNLDTYKYDDFEMVDQ